ncbi:RNA polymerase sigma factor [Haloechinothrix halophila]|uniref:RNA polymerase sigma factor n=1 Tax=Haloechinothrix halophila TaxID=1069073 RepID=UPI000415B0F0|nr:RNA polymerase sigma factor [Haloechinothrix halophila]
MSVHDPTTARRPAEHTASAEAANVTPVDAASEKPESVAGAVGDVDEAPGVADLAVALGVAQRGGEDGFRVLYRDVQPRVLRYLRALVGGDAEDVAAEAWLHIARDIGAFRGGVDDFRGWATRIARNRAMDHLRRQRRRPNADAPAESLHDLPAPSDTADAAVTALATDTAVALIARLPRDQAEAVLLRVVVGLDAKAAACQDFCGCLGLFILFVAFDEWSNPSLCVTAR